jgi:hypothetical protein
VASFGYLWMARQLLNRILQSNVVRLSLAGKRTPCNVNSPLWARRLELVAHGRLRRAVPEDPTIWMRIPTFYPWRQGVQELDRPAEVVLDAKLLPLRGNVPLGLAAKEIRHKIYFATTTLLAAATTAPLKAPSKVTAKL